MPPSTIMFVAGDPSGDEHASHIVKHLVSRFPGITCTGIGGPAMQAHGFKSLLPFEEFNRMGFWEVLLHLPFFLGAKKRLVDAMDSLKPGALVCVDYPGLNIPLLKEARRRAIPVVWYIVPQVWAWKGKRAAILGECASFIGVVFPFETGFFKRYKAPVSFVGHPLVEAMENALLPGAPPGTPTSGARPDGGFRLSLVPGSRPQEVRAILPSMVEAALLLKQRHRGLTVAVSRCKGLPRELFQKYCGDGRIELFDETLRELLSRTDGALVTSGTATLETALARVPLVIVYRTSPVSYGIMKRLIKIPFIGLSNIVAGEKLVPECIQGDATARRLAEEMEKFIDSRALFDRTVERLSRLKEILGDRKPSVEMADAIAALIDRR